MFCICALRLFRTQICVGLGRRYQKEVKKKDRTEKGSTNPSHLPITIQVRRSTCLHHIQTLKERAEDLNFLNEVFIQCVVFNIGIELHTVYFIIRKRDPLHSSMFGKMYEIDLYWLIVEILQL